MRRRRGIKTLRQKDWFLTEPWRAVTHRRSKIFQVNGQGTQTGFVCHFDFLHTKHNYLLYETEVAEYV